ncbi:hypothetical protein [Caldivirga maquilingensis]|uniref:hypothetical protein n=1 Tax=Caldivirga maquilingensis TaxID=76887 RepID=UPI00064E6AA7|nr:hypothetical protein [Caldivirga maquilingensis]
MNIKASVRTMSSLLSVGKASGIGNVDSAVNNREYESLRDRVNDVVIIPGFNGPIVLVYDKRSGTYRLV